MELRKIKLNLLFVQGIGYRLFVLTGSVLVAWFVTQDFQLAWKIGVGFNSLHMAFYYIYHYLFLRRNSFNVPQKKFVLWFTGLPCSGKTTVANKVQIILRDKNIRCERLDGDMVRTHGLSNDLGFSEEDRKENLFRVAFVAKLLSQNNVVVLASFVSPNREVRDIIRGRVVNFIEVFVKCSPKICAKRDVKGMWKKAEEGKIKNFTGYNSEYEEPLYPELILNTQTETIEESVEKVMNYLKKQELI